MTLQTQDTSSQTADPKGQADWLALLQGKTIRGVRPTHDNGPVPDVNLLFTDDTALTISVKPGVYFEGCLINTLRRAQPIVEVVLVGDAVTGIYTLTIRSRTFRLLEMMAVNKDLPADEFPFMLATRTKRDG